MMLNKWWIPEKHIACINIWAELKAYMSTRKKKRVRERERQRKMVQSAEEEQWWKKEKKKQLGLYWSPRSNSSSVCLSVSLLCSMFHKNAPTCRHSNCKLTMKTTREMIISEYWQSINYLKLSMFISVSRCNRNQLEIGPIKKATKIISIEKKKINGVLVILKGFEQSWFEYIKVWFCLLMESIG